MLRFSLICALWLGINLLAGAAVPAPADTLFKNGFVYTVNAGRPLAQAIAIGAGRILYVGDNQGADRLIGRNTQVVDLHGRMLMPGLVDGHMHPLEGGRKLIGCSLNYATLTESQFVARIRACHGDATIPRPQGWLIASAWFQEAMQPAGLVLTKATLDAIDSSHPIVVYSSFGHSALLNSPALKAASITEKTPDPAGGSIRHDAAGQPTGLLEDLALDLITRVQPAPSPEDDLRSAQAALQAMARQGITSFLDAWAVKESLIAFSTLQKRGQLTARAHFAPLIDPAMGRDPKQAVASVLEQKKRFDQGPLVAAPGISVGNAKLFMDGVISAPANSGVLLEPYRVNRGTAEHPDWQPGPSPGPAPYFPPAVLHPLLKALVQAHIDPHMHADGDGAVRIALDGVASVRKALPHADFRPAIAHDELVAPADRPRFAALGAIPVLSFQWEKRAPDTVDAALDTLGPQRQAQIEPASLLEKAGARIAYGSDWPVDALNEWFALKVGVTRRNSPEAGEKYAQPLGSQPGLSRASVLRAITLNSSWELRQEKQTGSLEVGKLADLIVLDRNLLQIPAEDIAHTRVLLTMVGGKVVYGNARLEKTPAP